MKQQVWNELKANEAGEIRARIVSEEKQKFAVERERLRKAMIEEEKVVVKQRMAAIPQEEWDRMRSKIR